jgi:hypothetical protein
VAGIVAVLFLAALAAAVVWKLYQLSKAPHDAPLRSVTLCLVCAAAFYPLAMPGGPSGLDSVSRDGMAKLMQNVLLLATVYFLMCFYLYSSADEQGGRRRARWEGLVVIVVMGIITVAATTVPHEDFAGSLSTADLTCGARKVVAAGQAAYRYSLMTPPRTRVRRSRRLSRTWTVVGCWSAPGGSWLRARWGRWSL